MQKIEFDAKLFCQRDHFQDRGENDGQIASLAPGGGIMPTRFLILLREVVDQFLVFGMDNRHNSTLAQYFKDAGDIAKMRHCGWRGGVAGGKKFDASNLILVNALQLVDAFTLNAHVDGKVTVGGTL